jgi:branched-chain amino acid transport system substrate-binding protein
MKHINIGVLIPNSSIFPIGKSFEKGLKEGLKPLNNLDIEFELVNEFAGQNGVMQLTDTFDRFFNYHEADLVTGIISSRTAEDVAVKFKEKQKALIINNVGGQVPNINKLNEYVFINSPHLWRHAWSLGHYGAKNFGKNGMYVSAVYDAGYSFSQMFSMGMEAANMQTNWSFTVGTMPQPGKLTDMEIILPHIEAHKPDFILATFCGTETRLFLNEFIKLGLHKEIKVLGLPYLTSPLYELDDDLAITSTQMYLNQSEITPDKVFHELGLQTGAMIAAVAPHAANAAELQQGLAGLKKCFNVTSTGDLTPWGLDEKVMLTQTNMVNDGKQLELKSIGSYETYMPQAEDMRAMFNQPVFGWINPYLCI